jgi:hypothetical protein
VLQIGDFEPNLHLGGEGGRGVGGRNDPNHVCTCEEMNTKKNPNKPASYCQEIRTGKLHFLCSEIYFLFLFKKNLKF